MNEKKKKTILVMLENIEPLPLELRELDVDDIANSKDLRPWIYFLKLLHSADSLTLQGTFSYFLDECVSNEPEYGEFLSNLARQDMKVAPALFRYLRRTEIVPAGSNLQLLLLGIGGEHIEVRADAIMLLAKQSESFLQTFDTFDEEVNFWDIESTQKFNQTRAIEIAKYMLRGASFADLIGHFPHENRSVFQLLLIKYAIK